jgi:hypothetical protein
MVVRLCGSRAMPLRHANVYAFQRASHIPNQVPFPDTSMVQPMCTVVRRVCDYFVLASGSG